MKHLTRSSILQKRAKDNGFNSGVQSTALLIQACSIVTTVCSAPHGNSLVMCNQNNTECQVSTTLRSSSDLRQRSSVIPRSLLMEESVKRQINEAVNMYKILQIMSTYSDQKMLVVPLTSDNIVSLLQLADGYYYLSIWGQLSFQKGTPTYEQCVELIKDYIKRSTPENDRILRVICCHFLAKYAARNVYKITANKEFEALLPLIRYLSQFTDVRANHNERHSNPLTACQKNDLAAQDFNLLSFGDFYDQELKSKGVKREDCRVVDRCKELIPSEEEDKQTNKFATSLLKVMVLNRIDQSRQDSIPPCQKVDIVSTPTTLRHTSTTNSYGPPLELMITSGNLLPVPEIMLALSGYHAEPMIYIPGVFTQKQAKEMAKSEINVNSPTAKQCLDLLKEYIKIANSSNVSSENICLFKTLCYQCISRYALENIQSFCNYSELKNRSFIKETEFLSEARRKKLLNICYSAFARYMQFLSGYDSNECPRSALVELEKLEKLANEGLKDQLVVNTLIDFTWPRTDNAVEHLFEVNIISEWVPSYDNIMKLDPYDLEDLSDLLQDYERKEGGRESSRRRRRSSRRSSSRSSSPTGSRHCTELSQD